MENTALYNLMPSRARALKASQARVIAELGMLEPEVIPLWVAESAWQTRSVIVDAAIASLKIQQAQEENS